METIFLFVIIILSSWSSIIDNSHSLSSSSSINDDSSIIRKGLELDWLCPSVLLYLVAVCPPIWILELKMADIRQDYQNYRPDKCYHQYFYLMVISPGEKGCVYFTNLSRAKLVGVKNQPKGFSFFLNWCRCRFSEIVLLWQVWINFLKVSNPKVFIVHLQWFCRSSRPYELGKSVTDWPGSVLDTCYHI